MKSAKHQAPSPGVGMLINFGSYVAGETCRHLEALAHIEAGLFIFERMTSSARSLVSHVEGFEEQLHLMDLDTQIPDSTDLLELFSNGQNCLKELHQSLVALRDARRHEDGDFEHALEESIESVMEGHNAVNRLRWAIMEADADRDTVVGPFTTIDGLVASLRS